MSENENLQQGVNTVGGPAAPKDPIKKRSCLYVVLDTAVEATARSDGKNSQELYLDAGRLKNKVQFTSGVEDEEILNLLDNCEGFHKLVHSIGISVKAEDSYTGSINFVLHNWGKENIYETGTLIQIPCPTDGTEVIMTLEDYEWSEQDNVIGKFAFEFDSPGAIANATVVFYLNDGYEVPELILEAPVDFSTTEYKQMIEKSLLSLGNTMRLKSAIEKAKRGEEVTIAYIGGSITQGAGAKPINTLCYAYQSYLKFKEMYGKDGGENVHFIKAGVGGTPSELGMLRYDRDILRDGSIEPDVVIIEFAVNDAGDETEGNCFESLCLKALKAKNKPAVIVLFSVFINDWNLQDRIAPIGAHYDLPMVSVKDAVVDQFKLTKEQGNVISKKQYFYDIYHPTNDGHMVMADCLAHLFAVTGQTASVSQDIITEKAPFKGNDYTEVQLIDRKDNTDVAIIEVGGFTQTDEELQMVEMDANILPSPQFPHNWMHTASSGNESFQLKITSKNLLVIFKDSGNNDFGKAEVYSDGTLIKTLDPHQNNWTHCNPVIIYQENTSREHNVEIKMAQGDEEKCFTILGFGFSK